VANTVCTFDAAETGNNPQTHLYTKLVNTAFNVDVLKLLSTTTIDTTYTGTVSVDLVDVCPNGTALNTAQSITFVAANKGRYPVSMISANAAPSAQVRIKANGATLPACSYDKFAIRPQTFTVSSTDATNNAATGKPAIKAGTVFNLTAASVAGYNGTPSINVTAVSGTPVAGTLAGSFSAASASTGTATGSFTYIEVGNFGLAQNAVYDTLFTTIDQSGDCAASSFSNTKDANGMYGCSIGSTAVAQVTGTSGFGRFIPDHFDTAILKVSGVPMDCPSNFPAGTNCPAVYNGFVYSGQPFTLTVTARNANGGVTANYNGVAGYSKKVSLSALGALGMDTAPTGPGSLGLSSFSASDFVNGSATGTTAGVATTNAEIYTFTSASTAPTAIYIRADDGEASSKRLTFPDTTSIEGGVEVLSGRIKVSNAYGSELLPLTVQAVAQYYTANGWVNSTPDSITQLVLASTYPVGTGATTVTLTPTSSNLLNGILNIKLGKPSKGAGSATITPTAPAYLPVIGGTATFGIYKNNNGFIYRRESY
jgi:MSHA biogenesis protein MshQ